MIKVKLPTTLLFLKEEDLKLPFMEALARGQFAEQTWFGGETDILQSTEHASVDFGCPPPRARPVEEPTVTEPAPAIEPAPEPSSLPKAYAMLRCATDGLVQLDKENYEKQLKATESPWICPRCDMAAVFVEGPPADDIPF